jgi:hypothetical protein
MWRAFFFVSAILASAVVNATIIAAETVAGAPHSVQANDPEGVNWTQTGSYTDVSIFAVISAQNIVGNGTGTVFLTTKIGAGTTTADEIARTTLSGIAFGGDSLIPLFSGLTLGPGTYLGLSWVGPR